MPEHEITMLLRRIEAKLRRAEELTDLIDASLQIQKAA